MLFSHVKQPAEVIQNRIRVSVLLLDVYVGAFIVHFNPGFDIRGRETRVWALVPVHREARIITTFEPDSMHNVGHIRLFGWIRGLATVIFASSC